MNNLIIVLLISLSTFGQTKNDDLALIMKKVFILETVEGFFLDMNPIYIVANEQLKENKIRKIGSPFKILSASEINKNKIEDYIVFEKIFLDKKSAKLIFRYDVEGMTAEIYLKKENNDWVVTQQKVVER